MTNKVVPSSLPTERALLGAMLLSAHAREQAVDSVLAEEFYSPLHRDVFATLRDLTFAGQVDRRTVGEECRRRGMVIDEAMLTSWEAECPSTGSAQRYALIVSQYAAWRALIQVGLEITEAGWSAATDPAELIDEARSRLASVELPLSGPPKGLQCFDEMLDDPKALATPWVIPGLMRRGWRCMVVGLEARGKTTLLRQIAFCAAGGVHPFTFRPIPPVRALVVDLENPVDHVRDVSRPIRDSVASKSADWQPERIALWHREQGINVRTRGDKAALEAAIVHHRPDLVILGPMYKAFRREPREGHEEAAEAVQQVFDELRVKYKFALILEHHVSKGHDGKRVLDPYGSSLWYRWLELGLRLENDKEGTSPAAFKFGRFRPDRMPNSWPPGVHRGGLGSEFPWVGYWPEGRPLDDEMTETVPTF